MGHLDYVWWNWPLIQLQKPVDRMITEWRVPAIHHTTNFLQFQTMKRAKNLAFSKIMLKLFTMWGNLSNLVPLYANELPTTVLTLWAIFEIVLIWAHTSLWLRFIDDIFLLWTHGPESLTNFLEQLNSQYSVHFTWNTPPSHVTFLDVDVHIDHCEFHTSVHAIPNNLQHYLHHHSCQPKSTKRSIPYSLASASVAIPMTSTPKLSPPKGIQSPFSRNSYPMPSISQTHDPTNFLLPLLIIQDSANLQWRRKLKKKNEKVENE